MLATGTWQLICRAWMGGCGAQFASSGALSELREMALCDVPGLVQANDPPEVEDGVVREYDVFIAHASEDRPIVVRALADALQSHGLRVWYDEFELRTILDSRNGQTVPGCTGPICGSLRRAHSILEPSAICGLRRFLEHR